MGMSYPCRMNKRVLPSSYSGVVTKKYKDKSDHNSPTLLLEANSKRTRISYLKPPFYNQILLGDSLIKIENTLELTIIRNDSMFNLSLDHGCEN